MTPTQPSPTDWLVRQTSDLTPRPVPTAAAVLVGVRDGEWETTDEVRGPGERMWVPIEEHPAFADAVSEMGPPPPEPVDETTLDMNPLIDVALVLLIFFILTATVTSLRRTIEISPPQTEDAGTPKQQDLKQDRAFTLIVSLDERGEPTAKVTTGDSEKVIAFDELDKGLTEVVRSTGRKEMILKMQHNDLTWKTYPQIHSAATEAGVTMIYMPEKKLPK